MLKRNLIATPLVGPSELPPVTIVPLKQPGRLKTFSLATRVLRFVFSILWAQRFRHESPAVIAARVRSFLEDLGGLWVKAGQLISLRTDMLSREMADELTQLQYHAYGFAPETAHKIVSETLGRPLEQVFDVFEDLPFAAASISQEHRAHLRREDTWVVVKVQRPGVLPLFERDLRVIGWLARWGSKAPGMAYAGFDKLFRELQNVMREEIDYRYETSNLRRMRKSLRKHKVYVPKVFEKYGGPHVIVMEFVEGPLMSDYLRVERADPTRLAAWRQENNITPSKVGSRLMRSFWRQLFEDNLFHSDLHPGNIVLLRNSRFALIDLGTIGQLDANFAKLYKQEWQAISEHNYVKAADVYALMVDSLPPIDLATFRARFVEACRTFEGRSHLRGLPYHEKSPAVALASEFSAIARDYKMQPTWQFLRVGRATATADASLNSLLGEKQPAKIMRRYFREAQERSWKRLRKTGLSRVGELASTAIESVGYLSTSLRRQAIQFEGVQGRIAYIFSWLFRAVRAALVLAGLLVVYTYMYQQRYGPIEQVHPILGGVGRWVSSLPPINRETGLLLLVLLATGFFIANRVGAVMARRTPRMPSGQLDA
jgi:ubiquinone biosynthesis protein